MEATEAVPISVLQHWSYCPRQCVLIHIEQAFADNVHTARGHAVHALVDEPGLQRQGSVRIERALPLWSERLGLVGKADLVELLQLLAASPGSRAGRGLKLDFFRRQRGEPGAD